MSSLIKSLSVTAQKIATEQQERLARTIQRSYHENGWFVSQNCQQAWDNAMQWLQEDVLTTFMAKYTPKSPKKVGVVAAGNIPMVGFHDVLMLILAEQEGYVKLSHQDKYLIPFFIQQWEQYFPEYKGRIQFVEHFMGQSLDKVIATGSDNTARYFEYYFRNIETLIRKNRFSVAILQGNETKEQLNELAKDCFDYFGLGCRNVSHIFLPAGYDAVNLCPFLEMYTQNRDHDKWLNNYTYHKAVLMMNLDYGFYDGGFFMLREMQPRTNPPAMIGYSFYKDKTALNHALFSLADNLQCVVDKDFGSTQKPTIDDFADNVDTMAFLCR